MNRYWPRCRYIRLRHRVCAAIVLSIVVTAAFVVLATHLVGSDGYRSELLSVDRFASERFAEVWDNPGRRRDLALAIERSFAVSLTLRDPNGHIINGDVMGCTKPDYRLRISGPEGDLGSVALCWNHSKRRGTPVAIGLIAGALVLWVASGGIARRLARPVDELLRVAREIGQGNLAARMRLQRHHRDEVGEIAEAVNDMAVRIERQVSGQRELLAAVSHEYPHA